MARTIFLTDGGLSRFALAAFMCAPFGALAQTSLPTVVVTTPSPVSRPSPAPAAPPKQAPAQKAAPAAQPAQQAAQSAPAPAPVSQAGAPGVLIVPTDSFASVTVIPSEALVAERGANLADSLQNKPGITGSTFAAGASRPIIRGLDNNRVLVQENGISSGDVSAISEDHAVPIDPNAASRVEVVRGPATLRYGGQAIGGIVNAMNGRIPDAIPRNGVSAEVRTGVSSVDNGRDIAEQVTAGAGNVVAYADRFDRRASDYQTPRGLQRNSFLESSGFAFGSSMVGTDGFAGVAVSRFSSVYGIPGGEAASERKRIDMEQTKLQSKGEWRANAFGIEAIRYWYGTSAYGHSELLFDSELGRDAVGSRFTNRQSEGRLEVQHQPVNTMLGRLTGAVGVQSSLRNVRGTSFEGDSLLDPARTRSTAGFWFEELQTSRDLRFQAAIRYEGVNVKGRGVDIGKLGTAEAARGPCESTDPSDPDAPVECPDLDTTLMQSQYQRTYRPMSGSLGLLYDLPAGVVMRVTGQYTERAPAEAELFSRGAHEATGTFEIGNPNLVIERARSVELGFRRAVGGFRFDANTYYTEFRNFIYKRLTGQTCEATLASCEFAGGEGGDLRELRFQQRDATFYGAELIGQLDIAPVWRGVWGVEGQYDFVHAQFANGEYVPRIPPHRLGGGVYYRDNNWLAKVGTLHAFRQGEIGRNETPTSGYTLLNAELSYTQRLAGNQLTPEFVVGIRGDNLLNDDVRNSVSFKKDEVLLPGASVRLFGVIKLN